MLYSRFGEKIKKKNVAYLFIEFVILVLGFYLSLQFNEWQNDREHRELELQYLKRLESDFTKSSLALNRNNQRVASSLEKLDASLTILTNEIRVENDYQKLFEALQSSSIQGSFEIFFGTFEELKDTGNMRLIESNEVRESLGNVWQKYISITRISEIRNMLRGNTFPVMAKHVKPLQGNKLTFDNEMVEENPRELYVAMSIIRANLRYDLEDSVELLALVDESLALVRNDIQSKN